MVFTAAQPTAPPEQEQPASTSQEQDEAAPHRPEWVWSMSRSTWCGASLRRRYGPGPSSPTWPVTGLSCPLTRMRVDPGPIGVGWRFTATTGVGRLGFDDDMVVELWEPPDDGVDQGRFVITENRAGPPRYADVRVEGQGDARTLVRWTEEIIVQPAWLGARLAPVVDPAVALLFGRVVGSPGTLAEAGVTR